MIRSVLALATAFIVTGTARMSAQQAAGALTAPDFVDIQQLYRQYNWALDSGDSEGYTSTSLPTASSTTTSATTRS